MPTTPLTATDLDDENAVAEAIDLLLLTTCLPTFRPLRQLIRERLRRLRDLTTPEAWDLVLEVEALLNERSSDALIIVARWAFREGLREGRAGR